MRLPPPPIVAVGVALLVTAAWGLGTRDAPPLGAPRVPALAPTAGFAAEERPGCAVGAAAEAGAVAVAKAWTAPSASGVEDPAAPQLLAAPPAALDLEIRDDLRDLGAAWVSLLDGTGRLLRRERVVLAGRVRLEDLPAAARYAVVIPEGMAGPVAFSIPDGPDAPALAVGFGRAWTLEGSLHDPCGHPAAGAEVRVRVPLAAGPARALDGSLPRPRAATLDDQGTTLEGGALVRRARVDTTGRFRLPGLPWQALELELTTADGGERRRVQPGESPQLTVGGASGPAHRPRWG